MLLTKGANMIFTPLPQTQRVQNGPEAGKEVKATVKCAKCERTAKWFGWVNPDPEVEQTPWTLCDLHKLEFKSDI